MIPRLLALLLAWTLFSTGVFAQALLPNAEQTFLDQNGAPLNGGSVYFYIPTTSTPKATYSDQGLSVMNTNPVVLDAGGRAIIWGSGSYREVVKDQFGNTIWDQVTFGTTTPGTVPGNTMEGNWTGSTASFIANAMPSCSDTSGQHLNYVSGTGVTCGATAVSSRQVLTTGTVATYVTPAGARQLRVRMVGGGGGGGQNSSGSGDGSIGGTTTFNSITAVGGGRGDHGGNGGAGGTGGTGGSLPNTLRTPGNPGQNGITGAQNGSNGGASMLGGGAYGAGLANAANNTGGGGAGQNSPSGNSGGGGGAGEYVELIINAPTGAYTYTVGAGGASGGTGTGAGGSGLIIVDEFY